jgi:LPS export ABC transporter protein LptC
MKKYFITFGITLFLFSCTEISDLEIDTTKNDIPQHESWNSTITLSKKGQNTAIVRSGHLAKYTNKKLTYLSDTVDVYFFYKDGNVSSHLKSMIAEIDEDQNNLLALKNVVVISDSGVTLYTEKLEWIQKLEKIISDTFVTIITEKDTVYGIGMESDASLINWKIFKPVAVTDRELNKKK